MCLLQKATNACLLRDFNNFVVDETHKLSKKTQYNFSIGGMNLEKTCMTFEKNSSIHSTHHVFGIASERNSLVYFHSMCLVCI